MSVSLHKQYLRARNEVDSSMIGARNLFEQWLAATNENPTGLTKKDIDYLGKAFKNRLLTVKWDCEDLEELLSAAENDRSKSVGSSELEEAKRYVLERRQEISRLMNLLDEAESTTRRYSRHGLSPLHSNASQQHHHQQEDPLITTANNMSPHEVGEEVQFDKTQVVAAAAAAAATDADSGEPSIFTNALYDHLRREEEQLKASGFVASQVFNNLVNRPNVTNVYMNPNENETILDMLETEYYNPPAGLHPRSRVGTTVRKFLETDRNRFMGTIALLCSFPLLVVIFMIA